MRGRTWPILLGLACACLAGCVHVGPRPVDPWRLLALSPLPEAEQANASSSSQGPAQPRIGVGPVQLPGYLDQDQIVTRISQNRLTLSENARWIEPLEDNMARVLAENLSQLMQTDRVAVHPWPGRERPIYQLEIDVQSFETDTAGTAHLAARWLLRNVATRETIAEKQVQLTASAAASPIEQPAASLSQALGNFSREIAGAIGEVLRSGGSRAPRATS
jgi:uncharacterized lipoprotein YmbA